MDQKKSYNLPLLQTPLCPTFFKKENNFLNLFPHIWENKKAIFCSEFMGRTNLNKMSDLETNDPTKDSIFYMFSQDEFDVAKILLDFHRLISSSNNLTLSMNNNSSKSCNFKSSRSLLPIPPSPPRPKKIYEDLQKEYSELIVQKETFQRELEKVRSYHEQQKAFNLFLKKEEQRLHMRPSRAPSTTVEVGEDPLPPKKDKKIIKIKNRLRTGKSRQG